MSATTTNMKTITVETINPTIMRQTANHQLAATRAAFHHACCICSDSTPHSWELHCEVSGPDEVEGFFTPEHWMTGYDNLLHGGVIASLLDSAMTQCLFAKGKPYLTALFNIRYRKPALAGANYRVTATIDALQSNRAKLHATLINHDEGFVVAEAESVFVEAKQVINAQPSASSSHESPIR